MANKDDLNRPPAMTDVAVVAGVSHQTVSRVINGKGSVRDETRQKVLAAIEQLGYRPNEAARSLVTRQSRVIGIITTQFVNYGPASTLLSVQLAAKEAGFYVSVATLQEFTEEALRDAVDLFFSQGVAGIVAIAPLTWLPSLLGDLHLPAATVVISSSWDNNGAKVTRVGVDQRAGARRATRYLARQGCRSIAHIAGPLDWFDAAERRDGWLEALAEDPELTGVEIAGDWSARSGYEATQELLGGELPDALFVANDQMSLGALRALSEADVRVPHDIRLIGFDDETGSEFFSPSLTTVRQDFEELGATAMAQIIKRLEGSPIAEVSIEPELVVRTSA